MSDATSAPRASRRAIFFDRDGTLIDDEQYLSRPEQVRLRPGAATAVLRANRAGWAAVVITNQSGIARGLMTEDDYRRVAERLDALLAEGGARLDASYHCPHLPEITGACDCRKPGVALYERAAREHALDLSASAYLGDRMRDVEPARRFGGLGVLVPSRDTPGADAMRAKQDYALASTLVAAVDRALAWRPDASGAGA